MKISSLKNVPIATIVDCLLEAFEGYFVQMPSDVSFWQNRFEHARMDAAHSWGVFDQGQLVAFINNAIDFEEGQLTAFNTGTGVVPAYRGQALVDKMYAFGLPILAAAGIGRCSLEVIEGNHRAIRVYERLGFTTTKKLYCFKGGLSPENSVNVQKVDSNCLNFQENDALYSWDNRSKTIQKAGDSYSFFQVFEDKKDNPIGYFILNPKNGYIAQLETSSNNWTKLFDGIAQISPTFKLNNVNEKRLDLLSTLIVLGAENPINQFEMSMEF